MSKDMKEAVPASSCIHPFIIQVMSDVSIVNNEAAKPRQPAIIITYLRIVDYWAVIFFGQQKQNKFCFIFCCLI